MTQAAQLAQYGASSVGLAFKNRIINGNMVIDQRNAGAASPSTTGFYFGVDRFQTVATGGGAITMQQSSTAPTGFRNSLSATVLTADSSIAAGDEYAIYQPIEGFNVADIGFGTANAQNITLSFWVRSSITGTYSGALYTSSRAYIFTYSISSANTFEYKTVSLTADTSGSYNTTNGVGIIVGFDLGSGSNFNGTANTWQNGSYLHRTSGSVNWIANAGATFYITGVQLEVGSSATSFDTRSIGTELILCQRYYEKSYDLYTVPGTAGVAGNWTTVGNTTYPRVAQRFTVEKRATPTMTFYADSDGTTGNLNVWDNGTVRKLTASNIFVTSKVTSPEGDYASLLSARAFLYYNWVASAEL